MQFDFGTQVAITPKKTGLLKKSLANLTMIFTDPGRNPYAKAPAPTAVCFGIRLNAMYKFLLPLEGRRMCLLDAVMGIQTRIG